MPTEEIEKKIHCYYQYRDFYPKKSLKTVWRALKTTWRRPETTEDWEEFGQKTVILTERKGLKRNESGIRINNKVESRIYYGNQRRAVGKWPIGYQERFLMHKMGKNLLIFLKFWKIKGSSLRVIYSINFILQIPGLVRPRWSMTCIQRAFPRSCSILNSQKFWNIFKMNIHHLIIHGH